MNLVSYRVVAIHVVSVPFDVCVRLPTKVQRECLVILSVLAVTVLGTVVTHGLTWVSSV